MGRRAKAPEAVWTGAFWRLRFTHEGVRHDFKNTVIRKNEAKRKSEWVRERVAFVYSGAWAQQQIQGSDPHANLKEVAALYLAEKAGGEITLETAELYRFHLKTYLLPRWDKLSSVTQGALAAYQAERLKVVTYATIKKELTTIRQVLRFAEDRGWLAQLPKFPRAPKKSKGTRARGGARGFTEGFTAAHTAAIIPQLPEFSRATRDEGIRWPVRAFYELLDETGQRPGLLEGLRYGTHWRKGQTHLNVTEDIDKNRWARDVPLSARAVAILESVAPQPDGRMFKHLDFRHTLRKAARQAQLPEHIADKVHTYDLRHARTTMWVNTTGQIVGVGYLVGHKQMTTTNRYSHADRKQGQEVLSMSQAKKLDSGEDTGGREKGPRNGHCDQGPEALVFSCAKKRTRTSTGVTPLAPQGLDSPSKDAFPVSFDVLRGSWRDSEGPNSGECPHYFFGAADLLKGLAESAFERREFRALRMCS